MSLLNFSMLNWTNSGNFNFSDNDQFVVCQKIDVFPSGFRSKVYQGKCLKFEHMTYMLKVKGKGNPTWFSTHHLIMKYPHTIHKRFVSNGKNSHGLIRNII